MHVPGGHLLGVEGVAEADAAAPLQLLGVDADGQRAPGDVDVDGVLGPEQVTAHYVQGRLTVTVAAAASPEKRQIAIDTSAPEAPAIEASETPEAPEA